MKFYHTTKLFIIIVKNNCKKYNKNEKWSLSNVNFDKQITYPEMADNNFKNFTLEILILKNCYQ